MPCLTTFTNTVSNEDVKLLRASKLPVNSGDLFEPEVCANALRQFHLKSQVEASSRAAQSWRKPSWKPRPPKTQKSQGPRGGVSPVVPPVPEKSSGPRKDSRPPFHGNPKLAGRGRGKPKAES